MAGRLSIASGIARLGAPHHSSINAAAAPIGFDRVEVDNACVDAVERELIGCTQAFVQGDARA